MLPVPCGVLKIHITALLGMKKVTSRTSLSAAEERKNQLVKVSKTPQDRAEINWDFRIMLAAA